MSYQQVVSFNPAKMGRKKGWCQQNTRLGFGIDHGYYRSAKADAQGQIKNGTFHYGRNVPTNVAVPVYCDTPSVNEHVIVSDHGAVYSDGRRVAGGLAGFKVFGWGECCDNVRVVKFVDTPATGFLPAKGYWGLGDKDQRVATLANFMRNNFPAYTPVAALGPVYGPKLSAAIREFQRRTNCQPFDGLTGPKTYAMLKKYGFKG